MLLPVLPGPVVGRRAVPGVVEDRHLPHPREAATAATEMPAAVALATSATNATIAARDPRVRRTRRDSTPPRRPMEGRNQSCAIIGSMGEAPSATRPRLDAAAVARVARGDAVALRELYDRYGRLVYSFAYPSTGDATLSEECVQDVFVALWRRSADFDRPGPG